MLSFKAHNCRPIDPWPLTSNRMATASKDRTVKVWDFAGRQLFYLAGLKKDLRTMSPGMHEDDISQSEEIRCWSGTRAVNSCPETAVAAGR